MINKGKREVSAKAASANRHSPLQRLFAKQQPKLRVTAQTSKLLKLYSDDNNIYIAKLIQGWLSESS